MTVARTPGALMARRLVIVGILVAAWCAPVAVAAPAATVCDVPSGTTAMWITDGCTDPVYDRPVIDVQEVVTAPIAHVKVAGHFEGTTKKFTVYLPSRDHWQGRFFQNVYPLIDENAEARAIEFGAASGGYTVQTNGGGGYRVDAAAAKFGKDVARRYYGFTGRIYGYLWGGSGGSYQTISAMENSAGVWDGAVPFIVGDPSSIPNNFFIRALARLVLHDRAAQIADAVGPGGSGDPFAGLDDVQQQVLAEVTALGMPLKAWEDPSYVLGLSDPNGLLAFAPQIKAMDPSYADDFWSQPGYLGTEESALGERIRVALIDTETTIAGVQRDLGGTARTIVVDSLPEDPLGTNLDVSVSAGPVAGTWDRQTRTLTLGADQAEGVLDELRAGARVRVDNRWALALTTYPRHQVPTRPGFFGYGHYRNADGTPLYPQRPLLAGAAISGGVSEGGTHTGDIHGKMIVVSNLVDADAFPWHGAWYRNQVQEALGENADGSLRLWLINDADHIAPNRTNRLIDYTGVLERALRDLASWVESGRPPAESTRYDITGSQIALPSSAAERRGIQPIVDLTANGQEHTDVGAGVPVQLEARIEMPSGVTGEVVSLEWDTGDGENFTSVPVPGPPQEVAEVGRTVTYTVPGTYFPALRITAQRDPDTDGPFAQVQAIGRARVVVHR